MNTPDPFDERRFAEFLAVHPEVWDLFVHFTRDRIRRGFIRYSADAILHRIRFETEHALDDGTGFRVNNNWTPFFARRWREQFPEFADLFQTRVARVDRERRAA